MERLEARTPRPRRRGIGPLIVLGAFALVPALVLYVAFAWADGRVDDNVAAPAPASTIVDPPLPAEPLRNPVFTFRRMPTTVSRDVNLTAFESDVAAFTSTLNDRSCVSVSVDGQDVGDRSPQLAAIPASTLKLVVAATALDVLGADHRFTTRVVASAAPNDGTIDGDLVLVGGGDPLLSSNWYPTSNLEKRPVFNQTSLDALADSVVASGVTRVAGAVLGDGSRYDDEFYAPGWGDGVAGLEAGPYDSLMANDARVLGEDQRADEPNAAAAREFTHLLRDRGVTVDGEGATGTADTLAAPTVELATIDSAPLADVVAEMLTNSDNNTAELLVKEIGLDTSDGQPPPGGATRQTGLDVIVGRLGAWGIDTTNIVLTDGSGLGAANRLTCAALIAVLQRSGPTDTIGAALPVAGRSGTLADVFTDSPVAGRLLAKTGTLNNPPFNADPPAAKALAGYLPVAGGGAVEFALLLNGPTISDQSEYRVIWDDFVETVDKYPSGATPADVGLLP